MRYFHLLALFCLSSPAGVLVEAFHTLPTLLPGELTTPRQHTQLRMSTPVKDSTRKNKRNNDSSKRLVKLVFKGESKLSSQPVSLSTFRHNKSISFEDFFLLPRNRNLLLCKDANNVDNLRRPYSSKLMQAWAAASKGFVIDPDVVIAKDDNSYDVVEVSTKIDFPGLKLTTINTIGVKTVLPEMAQPIEQQQRQTSEDIFGMRYEFTLLDSVFRPEGNAPIVWLFNKLIGTSSDNGVTDEPIEPATSSFTTYYVEPATGPSDPDKIVFVSDSNLVTCIEFPSFLIRVLPVSLQKMEEQGSKAMQTTLDKEIGPSLKRFVTAFLSN